MPFEGAPIFEDCGFVKIVIGIIEIPPVVTSETECYQVVVVEFIHSFEEQRII